MKILFCGNTFPEAPKLLTRLLPDEQVIACPESDVRVAGMLADVIIPLMHRLEPELIRGTSARLIQQWGVGLEGVDLAAANRRGILVCNVPGDMTANADSTAEHALLLMLGLARKINSCFKAFGTGLWGAPVGEALTGNTALIVGLGRVGKALARKLSLLGMNVEAIRRTPNPEAEIATGVTKAADLPQIYEMAAGADFVISTVVLNDQTRGIFDRKLFNSMKRTAYVVNVSRGPVVNEADLLEALTAGTIAGAGLDVYSQEPVDPANPLLSLENVVATPHVGGATRQNYEGIGRIVADNILMLKKGEIPNNCANLGILTYD
jgi:phosphoglycerate dehydrogenase-like enzyme